MLFARAKSTFTFKENGPINFLISLRHTKQTWEHRYLVDARIIDNKTLSSLLNQAFHSLHHQLTLITNIITSGVSTSVTSAWATSARCSPSTLSSSGGVRKSGTLASNTSAAWGISKFSLWQVNRKSRNSLNFLNSLAEFLWSSHHGSDVNGCRKYKVTTPANL